jgi:DNA end-binding protein Ku
MAKHEARSEASGGEEERPQPRPFWTGTLTFGLVSVPVDLYPAVRRSRVGLRMLGPDGHPLARRYYCSEESAELSGGDIVRGYPAEDGRFILITDEELEAIEPRKSHDIDLRRFVERSEIDPRLLERPYLLAPSGESTKAYHLLAATMEQSGRAGIASFVMRGKEYLAAIFAEGGLLRAETMRFADELRTPGDIGLPPVQRASTQRLSEMEAALSELWADKLDESALSDDTGVRLLELAEAKRKAARDVVKVPEALARADDQDEDASNVVDIMSLLKQRIGAVRGAEQAEASQSLDEAPRKHAPAQPKPGATSVEKRKGPGPRAAKPRAGSGGPTAKTASGAELEEQSKKDLYERAKALDLPGRSSMSKEELARALRSAG